MSDTTTIHAVLPAGAVFGRLVPEGPGPTSAEVFESWDVDEDKPVELIGGWVLPMSPGNYRTGKLAPRLCAVLLPWIESKGWDLSEDALHRLPRPSRTVLYPDIAIHALADVSYLPGTESVGRVPDIVIEILGRRTFKRDMAPMGAKFLAYQMSGVREYYYTWPDGKDASGFVLAGEVYRPLVPDAEGYFQSPLLGRALRLVPPSLRPA